MTTLSTHVLDAGLGAPAVGMEVVLTGADGAELQRATTDEDGRVRFHPALPGGRHTLTFLTGTAFHPVVRVDFTVEAAEPHHHVALLMSPFAYTTYKGS